MRTTIFVAAIIILSSCQTFDEFKARFNKRYPTPEENSRREAIYLANKARI